jgi:hypothetical protein
MVSNKCAQIYGHHDNAQMDGLQEILDPLDRSTFNGEGAVGNEVVFPTGPISTCHPSIASNLLRSMLHPSSMLHPHSLVLLSSRLHPARHPSMRKPDLG